MSNDIGERIKELRIARGLTQEELGEKVGVQKAAIYKYEKGMIENIKRPMQIKLAQALGTDPVTLFYADENEDNDPDIREIARARKTMPTSDKKRMMDLLNAAFPDYFGEDYIDNDKDE